MHDPPQRRYLRRPHVWLITVLAIVGLATVPMHKPPHAPTTERTTT